VESFVVNSKQTLHNVHSKETCWGPHCVIHNPTEHHMRTWTLYWREDRRIFERFCPHGIGHNDPDQTYMNGDSGIHGCDGCCRKVEKSILKNCWKIWQNMIKSLLTFPS